MAQNNLIFPHAWQTQQEATAKNSGQGVSRTARGQPYPYYPYLTFWWRKASFRWFLTPYGGEAVSTARSQPRVDVARHGEHLLLGTTVGGMQGRHDTAEGWRAARAGGNAVTATARCHPSHHLQPGEQAKQIWSIPRVNVTYLWHRKSEEGKGFISNSTAGRTRLQQQKRGTVCVELITQLALAKKMIYFLRVPGTLPGKLMQLLGMNPRELSLSHSALLLKIGRKMSFVSNSKLFSNWITQGSYRDPQWTTESSFPEREVRLF